MIENTLAERGNNYGNFHTLSNLSQTLDQIIQRHYASAHSTKEVPNPQMPHFMAEAIHMICHKLARIANGNPMHIDSWHDIGGYSELVVSILRGAEAHQKAMEVEAANTEEAEQETSDEE